MSDIKKAVLIDGVHIFLPEDAKYVFQESNGVWYWSSRRPRIVLDDETGEDLCWSHKNKYPITFYSAEGYQQAFITDVLVDWRLTLQTPVVS
jgi:hypothetical protein